MLVTSRESNNIAILRCVHIIVPQFNFTAQVQTKTLSNFNDSETANQNIASNVITVTPDSDLCSMFFDVNYVSCAFISECTHIL